MEIAYGRVSADDQNPERQIIKFKELGVEDRFIFIDKKSGKDFNREEYKKMKNCIRYGDILYLDALDRLGRDYDSIIAEWKDITLNIGCDIICLDNPELFNSKKWKEAGDIGKVLQDTILSLLAYVAQTERKKILKRQKEGIAIAKAQGKFKGRKPIQIDQAMFEATYNYWREGNISSNKFMEQFNLKPNTFYRRIKEYERKRGIA